MAGARCGAPLPAPEGGGCGGVSLLLAGKEARFLRELEPLQRRMETDQGPPQIAERFRLAEQSAIETRVADHERASWRR